MAESHVISGLVAKRAEVAGQITSYQSEIQRLQSVEGTRQNRRHDLVFF